MSTYPAGTASVAPVQSHCMLAPEAIDLLSREESPKQPPLREKPLPLSDKGVGPQPKRERGQKES